MLTSPISEILVDRNMVSNSVSVLLTVSLTISDFISRNSLGVKIGPLKDDLYLILKMLEVQAWDHSKFETCEFLTTQMK